MVVLLVRNFPFARYCVAEVRFEKCLADIEEEDSFIVSSLG